MTEYDRLNDPAIISNDPQYIRTCSSMALKPLRQKIPEVLLQFVQGVQRKQQNPIMSSLTYAFYSTNKLCGVAAQG